MKMTNWMKSLAGASVALVSLATASAAQVELRVGSFEPEGHYLVQHVYIPYFEEIERRTNGELTFRWFHGGTLVEAPQTVDALRNGLVDIVVTTGIFTQESAFPATHVMTLPFQFDSTIQANHVFQRLFHESPEVQAEFEGLVPLGFHVSDFFNLHIHRDVDPVRTLADLQGLEIGGFSASATTYSEMLGATPRNLPLADIYVTLQRQAIDGVWFPTAPLIRWNMTDFVDSHSLVGGPFIMIPMTISQQSWDALTPEQQEIFRSMEDELTNFTGAIVDNRRQATLTQVEDRGDTIITFDADAKAEWVAAAQPAYDAWLATMAERGVDGAAILEQVQAYTAEYSGIEYTSAEWWGDSWQE